MKHALWIFAALYAVTAIVACGKNGDTPISPASNAGCPAGTQFLNGQCVSWNGYSWQAVSTGYASSAFKSDNYRDRTLSISNANTYTAVLRDAMAICDRGTYNYGTGSCNDYRNGYAQVTLQSVNPSANTARLTIEVQPSSLYNYGYGQYYASIPSGQQLATCGISMMLGMGCLMTPTAQQMQIARNPLAIDLVVSAINNSKGFEGRGYGASGTLSQNALIQFIVENGSLADGSFNYKIGYNGQSGGVFMQGKMYRCQDASCGFYYNLGY